VRDERGEKGGGSPSPIRREFRTLRLEIIRKFKAFLREMKEERRGVDRHC
jgi:hypothetical protein